MAERDVEPSGKARRRAAPTLEQMFEIELARQRHERLRTVHLEAQRVAHTLRILGEGAAHELDDGRRHLLPQSSKRPKGGRRRTTCSMISSCGAGALASLVVSRRRQAKEMRAARLLALLAARPAGLLQKLLVLLLAHALTALLDQRAHDEERRYQKPRSAPAAGTNVDEVRGWCNGSTRSFGVLSRGSNPRPRAMGKEPQP